MGGALGIPFCEVPVTKGRHKHLRPKGNQVISVNDQRNLNYCPGMTYGRKKNLPRAVPLGRTSSGGWRSALVGCGALLGDAESVQAEGFLRCAWRPCRAGPARRGPNQGLTALSSKYPHVWNLDESSPLHTQLLWRYKEKTQVKEWLA